MLFLVNANALVAGLEAIAPAEGDYFILITRPADIRRYTEHCSDCLMVVCVNEGDDVYSLSKEARTQAELFFGCGNWECRTLKPWAHQFEEQIELEGLVIERLQDCLPPSLEGARIMEKLFKAQNPVFTGVPITAFVEAGH